MHPGVLAAYSLRDQAQIETYRTRKSKPSGVTYDPVHDRDPRRQDAAKVVIPENNLLTQLHLPTRHQPRQDLLVTWDAWYGAEFGYWNTGIDGYKAWNLSSPGSYIWTEVRARLKLADRERGVVAFTDIRQYQPGQWGPNTIPMGGVDVKGRNYGNGAIGPMLAEFGVAPERWTRYWLYLREDGQWYRMYLWMADPDRGPVQVYDGPQIRPRIAVDQREQPSMEGTWDILRLEYNTSTNTSKMFAGRRPLVGYARNVVTLKNLTLADVRALLQRPVE
jgi:hypothetical protein